MRKICYSFPMIVLLCLMAISLTIPYSCGDDDDNDDATPTPTNTPMPTSTPTPAMGTLIITTVDQEGNAVDGEIFIDGESTGFGSYSNTMSTGTYVIAFGDLPGYIQPNDQTVTVEAGQTTTVEGVYTITACSFQNVLVNGAPYTGAIIEIAWDGSLSVEFDFVEGLFWDAWATCNPPLFGPNHGDGEGHFYFSLGDPGLGSCYYDEVLYFNGTGYTEDCVLEIYWRIY